MNVVESSKASMDGFLYRIKRSAYYNEIPYSCIASCGGSCYTLYRTPLSDKNVAQLAQPKEAAIMQQLRLLHGGDYNPEQWLDRPDILAQDIELMKKAHVNTVTLGVFSWSTLEPQEGVFELDWLADIIHNLYAMESIRSLQRPVRPALLGWHTNTPRCAESGQTGSGSCTTGGRITAIHRRSTGKKSASSTRSWHSGSAMTRLSCSGISPTR